MKNIILAIFILYLTPVLHSQYRAVSAGGDVSNNSGSVSFTLGLIDYVSAENNSGRISLGLQIPGLFQNDVNSLDASDPIMSSKKIVVFPNPATDFVLIRSTGFEQPLKYQLYNLIGSILTEGFITNTETQLPIYPYAVGSYFLSIQNSQGEIKRFKVIKE